MAFNDKDVRWQFYFIAKGQCECCNKDLIWENRDKGLTGAWHAHHFSKFKNDLNDSTCNMKILCINEPENCHLNHGHRGRR